MAGLTIHDPVTLTNVLASHNVIAGDTIYIRAGTYSGNWVVNADYVGSAANWITIRPYQNERVIINGQFKILGDYVRVIGLESTNNTSRDRSSTVGTVGFDCLGEYNEIVNCTIHDHDQGITTSAAVTEHVYYGNVVYFNGWNSGFGHGTYPQNATGNTKTIKNNIFIDKFGYGIHA